MATKLGLDAGSHLCHSLRFIVGGKLPDDGGYDRSWEGLVSNWQGTVNENDAPWRISALLQLSCDLKRQYATKGPA